MWSTIGNISAVVTLLLFVLYIIGHIWKIAISKNTLGETFTLEDDEKEIEDSKYYIDFSNGIGRCFSVASSNGIRVVRFYEIQYDDSYTKVISKKVLKEFSDIGCNEKVYARIDIGDTIPYIGVEIEKNDYVKVRFGILDSGKDGSLIKYDYKCSLSLKSFIYYLCS